MFFEFWTVSSPVAHVPTTLQSGSPVTSFAKPSRTSLCPSAISTLFMSFPCCINKTNGRPNFRLEQPVRTKSYRNFRTFLQKCRLVPFFRPKKPEYPFAPYPISRRGRHEFPRRCSLFLGSLNGASPDIRQKFHFRRAYLVRLGRYLTPCRSYCVSSAKCFLSAGSLIKHPAHTNTACRPKVSVCISASFFCTN